jgi:FeS assembly SUF system protein
MQHDMIDMNAPYDPAAAEEGATASAGSPLAEGEEKASKDAMIEALRTVFDPEIPVNLYDLGLIYDIEQRDNGDVGILMTLTTPACPVAGQMPAQVAHTVAAVDGVGTVQVTLTWNPPWTPEQMTEDARMILGF